MENLYEVPWSNLEKNIYTDEDLTFDAGISKADKILVLDDKENFDIFTNKYGYIVGSYEIIGINWEKVKKDFRGIKVEPKLFDHGFFNVSYKGKKYISWWDYEYGNDRYFD